MSHVPRLIIVYSSEQCHLWGVITYGGSVLDGGVMEIQSGLELGLDEALGGAVRLLN